ncbi:hypothetical protein [Baekduia soli]|uniref:hypothetical protein n=1 Tax=Baekduia soli TaxID=496014 RepID=UPI001651D685|nr:hypothetical protein [Baekduia soli]
MLEQTGVVTRVVQGRTHRLSVQPNVLGVAADGRISSVPWGRLFDVVDDDLEEQAS